MVYIVTLYDIVSDRTMIRLSMYLFFFTSIVIIISCQVAEEYKLSMCDQ